MTQPPRPQPNMRGTLGGDATHPWVTLRSAGIPLIASIGKLSTWLSAIDGGLEIIEGDDMLSIRIQPKDGIVRSRPEVYNAVRRLAASQDGWNIKWGTDD